MEAAPLRAYLVDDEPLAIERSSACSPASTILRSSPLRPTPRRLSPISTRNPPPPSTCSSSTFKCPASTASICLRASPCNLRDLHTAYDEYALRAFEVNSIDYLVKPIETAQLARALKKLAACARPQADWQRDPSLLLEQLAASLRSQQPDYPRRIASRVGERISFLDLDAVTHFIAQDKLTYAVVKAAATLSIRPLPISSAASTQRASCAFTAPRWSTLTGSTKSIPGSPAKSSSRSRMLSTRRFPSPATASAFSNPTSASDGGSRGFQPPEKSQMDKARALRSQPAQNHPKKLPAVLPIITTI